MGSGIALLLWTAKLLSPFLFLYHRYVSILKYNTAGVCLAIKKAMPVSVKFSSVIHLTVDNYYLRDFGFISISV